MRTAFWSFPFHPDEGVILGLKGKFGTWTFREEACMSDEGQSCLLKNSDSSESRVEFLTIFETGINNLNLLCFLFTFFTFVYLSSFLALPCEMLLGNSAFLSVLVSRYYWVQMKKKTLTLIISRNIDLSRSKLSYLKYIYTCIRNEDHPVQQFSNASICYWIYSTKGGQALREGRWSAEYWFGLNCVTVKL